VGSEANGISPSVIQACDSTLRIDMAIGVDSLSVPIATGILLNGLRERECNDQKDPTLDATFNAVRVNGLEL
jgi:tRNA G18 (ribose-2'-O)-methylase SpoU